MLGMLRVVKDPKFNLKQYAKRSAIESDIGLLIKEDTIVWEGDRPIIAYVKLKSSALEPMRAQLQELRFDTTERTGGLKTTSRVFGYQPRMVLRRDFCSATSLQSKEPDVAQAVEKIAHAVKAVYQETFPDIYAAHQEMSEQKIRPELLIKGTPFTSGIINKNNPLKYHFDAGNFKGVCSCMVAFKKDVAGGYLACPEYHMGFEIADKSLLIFDGQSILHGVTPIIPTHDGGYRNSLIFYPLNAFKIK